MTSLPGRRIRADLNARSPSRGVPPDPISGLQPVRIHRPGIQHASLRRPRPGRDHRLRRRLLLALTFVPLLLLAPVICREENRIPSLDQAELVGPRSATGPLCIEQAVDMSGSMARFEAERGQAVEQFIRFAHRELARDDVIAEAYFASTAALTIPPTPLNALPRTPYRSMPDLGGGTALTPAVEALRTARSANPTDCAARALVVFTDAVLGDDPDTLRTVLRAGAYTRIYAVLPGNVRPGRPSALTGELLDGLKVDHFRQDGAVGRLFSMINDADELDVIFGWIAADLTGQRLVKRE
ncbi:vWA domain-containing protein [Salinispora arenicola]|uniref:vWA domain-containing protein n=1 Tax=Salinispora arenicola TaxID=168697 RepID=UPI0003640C6B|nr:vWA domain-containing protein [Salinispora arenicola]